VNRSLAVAALVGVLCGAEKKPITAEQAARDEADFVGLIPSEIAWAPDGSRFYYHAGNKKPHRPEQNAIFEVARDGGRPRRLSEAERQELPPLASLAPDPVDRNFTRDRRWFVYQKDGDVFLVEVASGRRRRILNTDTDESRPRFSHDDQHVLFESGQNLYGWTLGTGELRQFTRFRTGRNPERKPDNDFQRFLEKQQTELFGAVRDREAEREARRKEAIAGSGRPLEPYFLAEGQTVSNLRLAPDGKRVTFTLAERARAAEVLYQRPVTKSGFTESATTRPKVGDPEASSRLGILTVADGKVQWVDTEPFRRPVRVEGPWWSEDGKQAVVKVLSRDFKDLWIARADLEKGSLRVLAQDHDDAWIPIFPSPPVRWMADSRTLFLTSERDGFRHLWTVDLEGAVRQRTRGRFDLWIDAPHPQLSRDRKRWYFHANLDDPYEYNLYALAVDGGEPVRLTPRGGVTEAVLSPDETQIAMLRSTPESPSEVFLMENKPGVEVQRVSHSTTPEFESTDWVVPEFVTFPDPEGVPIPARLYKPRSPHPARAALIQIHGSGYTQIVRRRVDTDYLHTYQQYLIAQGYTVLEIDYRGSAGYGRDFRTAIYRHMGAEDLASAVAGIDYLVRQHGIDRSRVGIFGRSYGGFLTLMALLTRPGVFAAGVAMAPVTDWAHYNHGYTGTILNMPQVDEESFRRSSPIYFAQNLQDPLLILHGIVDSNVLYQDSVRLSQRLIELKKSRWSLFSYPMENHAWEREDAKLDCLRRISEFFEEALLKRRPS
jgi:dipeptidyl aminopeptidase/acylaminoacyl peptidase